jgi:hypothetical protein
VPEKFTSEENALAEELDYVARYLVPSGLHSIAHESRNRIRRLREILNEVEGSYFTFNPTEAFRRILKQAARDMPKGLAEPLPSITIRDLMGRIFDFDDSRVYGERHAEIRKYGQGTHDAVERRTRRSISNMRLHLARALLNLEIKAKSNRLPPQPGDRSYVPRPALESPFFDAINAENRVVIFHGDAGTGKSTLADHLARSFLRVGPQDYVPTVSAHSENTLHDSLGDVLSHLGKSAISIGWRDRARMLRETLASDKGPPLIVIDGGVKGS